MNAQGLPGACFRPAVFEPTFQKHARQPCGGCQIHVTDRSAFQPVATGVALLHGFHRADPERFEWRPPPYKYEHEKQPIDILYGSDGLRRHFAAGTPPADIVSEWRPQLDAFLRARASYLLY